MACRYQFGYYNPDLGDGRGFLYGQVRAIDGAKIVISVADSGSGIPMEARQNLFRPFFTTKPVGKGTGMGLSLSKKIIERHEGQLLLEEGSNTCFKIELPLFQRRKTAA